MALIRDPIYQYFSKGFRGQPRLQVFDGDSSPLTLALSHPNSGRPPLEAMSVLLQVFAENSHPPTPDSKHVPQSSWAPRRGVQGS